jgi:hypothetical protein
MPASELTRKPQYQDPEGQDRNLPGRQRKQHQECRKTHLAPARCLYATEEQENRPAL